MAELNSIPNTGSAQTKLSSRFLEEMATNGNVPFCKELHGVKYSIPYLEACQKDVIHLKSRLSTKMELMQGTDIPGKELFPFVHVHAH